MGRKVQGPIQRGQTLSENLGMETLNFSLSKKLPERVVVIGASAGGVQALSQLLPALSEHNPLAVIVVIHIRDSQPSQLTEIFSLKTSYRVKEVDEKEPLLANHVFFAPPGYHVLLERDLSFSLSVESPVQYSRPSIDVLFESAAEVLGKSLTAILLTGANEDGARGLAIVKAKGGVTIVQNPSEAASPTMPEAGKMLAEPDFILNLKDIASYLEGGLDLRKDVSG